MTRGAIRASSLDVVLPESLSFHRGYAWHLSFFANDRLLRLILDNQTLVIGRTPIQPFTDFSQ